MSCHDQPPTHYFSPQIPYVGGFGTNYIVLRNVENFKFLLILQEEVFVKENEKSFKMI
jgi:hypothetical protein